MTKPSLLSLGALEFVFGADVLHENFTATIDVPEDYQDKFLEICEKKGFEVIPERDTVYTISYEQTY